MSLGYSGHGDVRLCFWNGSIASNRGMQSPGFRIFAGHHGSEVRFLSAMMGYLRRAEVDEAEVRDKFRRAAGNILSGLVDSRQHWSRFGTYSNLQDASGRFLHQFDEPRNGWQALSVPIATQPGVIEEVGATGLYTRHSVLGEYLMVIAQIPPWYAEGPPPEIYATELSLEDVPYAAELICERAMGEYRLDIRDFLEHALLGAQT